MRSDRGTARGIAVAATIAGASSAFASGNVGLGTVFVCIGLLAIVATFANRLPVVHRLPAIGAPKPPEIRFHLEEEVEPMVLEMGPEGAADAILCAAAQEGRSDEITRVLLNAYVVGSTEIFRCDQDGDPFGDGHRLRGPDAPYWAVGDVTIPIGAQLFFFRVTIPEPGRYEVVVSLQSPEFHDRGDHFYREALVARRSR